MGMYVGPVPCTIIDVKFDTLGPLKRRAPTSLLYSSLKLAVTAMTTLKASV